MTYISLSLENNQSITQLDILTTSKMAENYKMVDH